MLKEEIQIINVQEYLDKHYPKDQREEIKKLHFSYYSNLFYKKIKLIGHLDLSDFVYLEEFKADIQKLTGINVSNCLYLKILWIERNQISKIDLSNNLKLEKVCLDGNPWQENPWLTVKPEVRQRAIFYMWNVEKRNGNKIRIEGIEKLTDISDLDEWVENYDFDKYGDKEYHKICGGSGLFNTIDFLSLDNLSNKIIARNLIITNRLVDGENENYENHMLSLGDGAGQCNAMFSGFHTEKEAQEAVNQTLSGDVELLKKLQDLPYLKEEFQFPSTKIFWQRIQALEEELAMEREEIAKFHEKSQEYSLRQVEEITKKDQEIAELERKITQLEIKTRTTREN